MTRKKLKIHEEKQAENNNKIIKTVIDDEMKSSYLDYAMSVIVGRALPDIRDGLKPVHRRILFAMNDMNNKYNLPTKKCARIVGEVLGKYHPHGDSAVYDALVRMAQDFSLRYPLVIGQGNFGSIDGDNAAHMRYTEAKLAKISNEMLNDIDKETVDFIDNFDGSLKEPKVLPNKIPNLLINGSSGIAVGMATNIPSHNLKEVCNGVISLIDNPEISISELFEIIPGPDFPTAGIITGKNGIRQAYSSGRGSIIIKGKVELEEKKGRERLIITEIPYQVNKSMLIEQMADKVNEKIIQGISDIRDESDREGMRIVLELKKGANKEVITNQLFKYTRLRTSFGAIMLALDNEQPKTFNLKQMLSKFLEHRQIVIRKRTQFELKKAEDRCHILKGLLVALNHLNVIIALIKKSNDPKIAKEKLILEYKLTAIQSQAILDMKLQRLTGLEQQKIKQEHNDLIKLIADLKEILNDENNILKIIKDDMKEIIKTYGDERRTIIEEAEDDDLEIEDLVKPEDNVVTISHAGYIKRQLLDVYKTQKRGGKGVRGASTKEEDFIEHLFIANTRSYLLVFTDKGKVYWLKVFTIPEAARVSKGRPIINLVRMESGEKIQAVIPISEFQKNQYLLFATKKGLIKKTRLELYSNPRQGGIIAINLNQEDKLINVLLTDGKQNILIASNKGQAVKFDEKDARPVGRNSSGVRGIRLRQKDSVIGMILASEEEAVLTLTENGYGKRTKIQNYRLIRRGGKGVRNIICSKRNGKVVKIKAVTDYDDIMIISKNGILIRMCVKNINLIGRNTQGVRLMRLGANDKVMSVAKIEGNGTSHSKEESNRLL